MFAGGVWFGGAFRQTDEVASGIETSAAVVPPAALEEPQLAMPVAGFEPTGADSAAGPQTTVQAPAPLPDAEDMEGAEPPVEPSPRASSEQAEQAPAAGGGAAVWTSIAAGLDGALGAMASHCAWVGQEGERVILQMDEAHRHLLSDERRERLVAALAGRFEGVTRVEIRVGDAGWTPALEQAHRREQAQSRAEQAMAADRAVEDICEAFDGRLQSVRASEQRDSRDSN